jgi:ADP-ribosyl-[dinitrogen reductase] hydrolase
LGRTGTIAGRLLVEFGDSPEEAIRKVRAARPGSIETRAQEQYVRNCRPAAAAAERTIACLLGGAIGDALGYEVEFQKLPEIRERYGPEGITAPVLHDGKLFVSDDTQMTLFTLEGLANGSASRLDSIRTAYLDWYGTQMEAPGSGWLAQQAVLRVRRAPGGTCLSALHAGGRGTVSKPINDSKGCGGVMRVAPIGLVHGALGDTFQLAAEAAALTHGHPSGYLSAGMMAAIVQLLVEGAGLQNAIDQSTQILKTYRGHEETLAAVGRAVSLAAKAPKDHAAAIESLGGGWIGEEALAIALYAALSAKSFVEVVTIAANHGGDSDSTASIAGQIWGAREGLQGMPHDWVCALDVAEPLFHLARQLNAL